MKRRRRRGQNGGRGSGGLGQVVSLANAFVAAVDAEVAAGWQVQETWKTSGTFAVCLVRGKRVRIVAVGERGELRAAAADFRRRFPECDGVEFRGGV